MRNDRHRQIIEVCSRYPHDEKMLLLKLNSLKHLKKTYKTLECIGEILKINPQNRTALRELAKYLRL